MIESLRKNRKERDRNRIGHARFLLDVIGVLNIDLVFWGDEVGIKP